MSLSFSDCLIRDRHALRRLARACQSPRSTPELQQQFTERQTRSQEAAKQRHLALPSIEFPAELPIIDRLDEIQQTITQHQVVVLCGETGSGKSTQLPKICLSLGLGVYGRIGHTQPRRIAARSLANRIAAELGQSVGESIGYKVRFTDRVTENSHIKLMTDGILLTEIQRDPYLNEYDTLIIDEAHERSLNIDFLLGYLRQLLPKRRDLKLIITSATIDPQRFSNHFNQAPVIEVSGRTYPVQVYYRPPPENEENGGVDLQQGLLDAVDELSRMDRGDILVFFSGEREIREASETLRKARLTSTEVLPLYARQSPAEQARIFQPGGLRRIVLATNVAETSLTVPGIRYVIDTGTARISRYSTRAKIQRLPVEAISQASANQRKGRCGRVAAGICIRLYEETDFQQRDAFTEPEILRTNLAAVILQMQALGFGDIASFPFVEPPDNRMIKDGYRVLHELGAVDNTHKITRLGRTLARLPIDPRIGRMLLEAGQSGCLRETLIISAGLSVQDPRERPLDKQQTADEAHALFADEQSDFLSMVKLWDFLHEKREDLTRRKFERLCREYFLAPTRVREWFDIYRQLKQQMHALKHHENQKPANYDIVHKAILSGLLSHVGQRNTGKERNYLGARNTRWHIFPGSSQFKREPKWVMAAELVETTRLYARTVAQIQPEWIENLAGHLVKRSYSEPHWQARAGQVGAYEKVTLYGLPIVPRRRINYGPIDPSVAHDIFIRFGLVEDEVRTRAPFRRHNQALITDLHAQEIKARRHDLLVDEEAIYQFYAQRIPADIYSTRQLETWLRKQNHPKLLHMRLDDIRANTTSHAESQFPDHLILNGAKLPLSYHFEPGNEADGVTVKIPSPLLNQLSQGQVDWLIPGLITEKITAMIKGLPKSLRRQFVPAPDYVRRCLNIMQPGETPLHQTLAAALKKLTGQYVPEDAWRLDTLDPYLQMRICLLSADGRKTLACSRNLAQLQQTYAKSAAHTENTVTTPHALAQTGLKDWTCGDLPETVEIRHHGMQFVAYPALIDEGDSVSVRCLDSAARASVAHHAGLRRLFMLRQPKTVRDLRKQNTTLQTLRLHYAKAPKRASDATPEQQAALEDQLLMLAFDQTFLHDAKPIRDQAAFQQRYDQNRAELSEKYQRVLTQTAAILSQYHAIRKLLNSLNNLHLLPQTQDIQQQLDNLIHQGFLQTTPTEQLAQYPRYLQAITLRLQKLKSGAQSRDQQAMREMAELWQHWQQRDEQMREKGQIDPRLEDIRWQLEELRISLFAQEVKTRYPISVKRIQKCWKASGL